jgi:hypothetical protein
MRRGRGVGDVPFSALLFSALRLRASTLWVAIAMSGCAGLGAYGPGPLQPGARVDDARARMGEPTGRYALPAGGERLEYARGPYGRHTFMLDFDAGGRLLTWTQVLTERNFATIQPGQSRDEVLRTLGRPSDVRDLSFQKRSLWSYRYEAVFCQWFQVSLDRQDRVVEAGYGPDPLCDDDHPMRLR